MFLNKGSKGEQYIFVFENQDDVRDLSMELIKIQQNANHKDYLMNKFDQQVFSSDVDEFR